MRSRQALTALAAIAAAGCTLTGAPARDAASQAPAPLPASAASSAPPRTAASWAADVDAVCRLGAQMYPSIAYGVRNDVDLLAYGIGSLASSVAALEPPESLAERAAVSSTVAQGQQTAETWTSLATAPSVGWAVRVREVRTAAAFVTRLVELGARDCAALVPRGD